MEAEWSEVKHLLRGQTFLSPFKHILRSCLSLLVTTYANVAQIYRPIGQWDGWQCWYTSSSSSSWWSWCETVAGRQLELILSLDDTDRDRVTRLPEQRWQEIILDCPPPISPSVCLFVCVCVSYMDKESVPGGTKRHEYINTSSPVEILQQTTSTVHIIFLCSFYKLHTAATPCSR